MKKQILVADRVHGLLINGLKEMGYIVDYMPQIKHSAFLEIIGNYCGVIVNTQNPVRRIAIEKAPNLEFVARLGSGMDIIDVDYAVQKGIAVFSAPEGNANAVAEHTLGMLLGLFNNIPNAYNGVRQFRWEREVNRGRELEGLTVGVVGYGNNGSALVRKLTCLGVRILCYDKYKQRYTPEHRSVVECSDLGNLLRQSDIVSLHIPLTEETRKMVNRGFLEKCKDGVTLINTSRGAIVDLEALIMALKSGKVYGACLDVVPNENFDSLSANDVRVLEELEEHNIIITPHIAGWTEESFKKISVVILEKLKRWKDRK